LPVTDDPVDQAFWQGARERKLLIQHCSRCEQSVFPPRVHCPHCHQPLEWQQAAGSGRIWSFVTVHPPLLPAWEVFAPYRVVLVELDEHPGVRLVGNLLLAEEGAVNAELGQQLEQRLAIGDAVEVVFRTLAEDVCLPCWKRIELQ
jgi:uncharacterized OB-fold protein